MKIMVINPNSSPIVTASPLTAEVLRPEVVQLLPPGSDAGAWGAVAIARESLATGSAIVAGPAGAARTGTG